MHVIFDIFLLILNFLPPSVLFSSFKGEILLPWENRKPVTAGVLAEAAGAGAKWTSTLGPGTLRRTAGSGMNPVSALFMSEVARANALTPAQLTAHGRSVAVDLARIDEGMDSLENVPVRAISSSGGGAGDNGNNRRSASYGGGGGFSSSFLPNRPDDIAALNAAAAGHASSSSGQGGNGAHAAAPPTKSGSTIARPDLLLSAMNSGGMGGGGGHGSNGVGGMNGLNNGGRPQSSVIKSSAAGLLSAGLNNGANNNNNANNPSLINKNRFSAAPTATRSRQDSADSGGANETGNSFANTFGSPQAAPKRLFTKVASFFQGK